MVEIKLLATSNKGKVRKVERCTQNPVHHQRYPGKIEISLKRFSLTDLEEIAFGLKDSKITTLRLFCSGLDCEIIRFSFTDPATSHILIKFFSALAQALGTGGWLKHLELGFKPWKRDLRVLSQAIGSSTTLKELSLGKSRIGDSGLQLLAQGLSNCPTLKILDLSGCTLSNESHSSVELILKASVGLNAQAEWQSSLRASQSDKGRTNSPSLIFNRGLVALDLSFNSLSDIFAEHICDVLRLGAPLAGTAKEVYKGTKGNQMRRKSMKRFASIFGVWGTLRFVDLRDNVDKNGVGVLEDGEHLSYFSAPHDPFWRTGGDQIRKENRRLLRKESNLNWSQDCNKIIYPPLSETARLVEIEESQPGPQMHISCQGEEVDLSLSPLPHDDEESAYFLPTTVLLSSTERSEFAKVYGSDNNAMDSQVSDSTEEVLTSREIPDPHGSSSTADSDVSSKPTSRVATPSTPNYHSEYKSSRPNRLEVLPLPEEPVCEWDSCSTSASTDNTKLTDLIYHPGCSFDMIFDQLKQKSRTENTVQVEHRSSVGCGAQRSTEQYLADTWNLANHQSATQTTAQRVVDGGDDAEWDAFMIDMAGKLQLVQEKLDKVMTFAKPDVLVTAQIAMTTLQEGFQQLLAWEI